MSFLIAFNLLGEDATSEPGGHLYGCCTWGLSFKIGLVNLRRSPTECRSAILDTYHRPLQITAFRKPKYHAVLHVKSFCNTGMQMARICGFAGCDYLE